MSEQPTTTQLDKRNLVKARALILLELIGTLLIGWIAWPLVFWLYHSERFRKKWHAQSLRGLPPDTHQLSNQRLEELAAELSARGGSHSFEIACAIAELQRLRADAEWSLERELEP